MTSQAISDAHDGLKHALAKVLGAPWQRCSVHFLRDLRGHVHKDQHDALGAVIRSIFTAPDGVEARRRLADAVEQLSRRLPKIAALLNEAEDDVLAFFTCPREHWPKLRSTDEKFNGRRGCGSWSSRFSLGGGRGRPPSEAQVLGLMPAAQLAASAEYRWESSTSSPNGYVGDIPPCQGHDVEISRATGRSHAVSNSLCSNVRHLMHPTNGPDDAKD